MKRILTGTVLMVLALPCYATGDNVATSAGYVDAALELKQATIPAAGTAGVGAGSTVMTYTATSGTIGERALYTDASSYDASTDADKMITASALNGAITSMPTTTTTKLTCQNNPTCSLWTISDQTAYAGAVASSGVDLMTLIGVTGASTSYGYLTNDENDSINTDTYGITNPGEFVVDYGNKGKIHGYARCSSRSATDPWVGTGYAYVLQSDGTTTTLPDSSGQYCYCMLDGYTPNGGTLQSLSSPWVFHGDLGEADNCADRCADDCAFDLQYGGTLNLTFRAAVFGVTH